jgi:hypothetical protein
MLIGFMVGYFVSEKELWCKHFDETYKKEVNANDQHR